MTWRTKVRRSKRAFCNSKSLKLSDPFRWKRAGRMRSDAEKSDTIAIKAAPLHHIRRVCGPLNPRRSRVPDSQKRGRKSPLSLQLKIKLWRVITKSSFDWSYVNWLVCMIFSRVPSESLSFFCLIFLSFGSSLVAAIYILSLFQPRKSVLPSLTPHSWACMIIPSFSANGRWISTPCPAKSTSEPTHLAAEVTSPTGSPGTTGRPNYDAAPNADGY